MRRTLSFTFMALAVMCFAVPVFAQGGAAGSATNWVAITSGFAMAIASAVCGIGQSKATAAACEGLARNPAARAHHRNKQRLAGRDFVADDYSIADIAIWPWVSRYEWQTVDLGAYANVKRWYTAIAKRPAVQRGYKVPKDVGEIPMP